MANSSKFPQEYSIPVPQDYIRSVKSPHIDDLTNIHAFVKIRDLSAGKLPDKINPRCHDKIPMRSRIPKAIRQSLIDNPKIFHLINRGCLILAKKAWYNNKTRMLHFVIESEDDHGLVDGATTDRVLAMLKNGEICDPEFLPFQEEILRDSYIHIEIIAGDIDQELRIKLADARNTSVQVKEFSLEDLRGNFNWLKDILEISEFRGKIRYQENEPKPVDIRTVLGLLTLFHPNWKDAEEPIMAYTAKGRVIDKYENSEWSKGYQKLAPVVLDILRLYDYLHVNFQPQYMNAYGPNSKLGKRKEVRYLDPEENRKPKKLSLTGSETRYVLTDGWLYPLLSAFRVLLEWPKSNKAKVVWLIDPHEYFDHHGAVLVRQVVEQSHALGSNPNATGKHYPLWSGLKREVENHLLKAKLASMK